ncbi:MAG: hypothetical protein KF775_14890 [Cyclobacteriaceae bacterium]|nr:hypothetical protein [Cyclobacteriaceae bacterium]
MKKILFIMLSIYTVSTFAQEDKVSFALYDGIFIGGYVDNGAFLNFTGPNINATYKNSKFILGMLPSLRFKEDKGTPKNAFVTPNLGIGFTCSYKMWAVQLPLYYNAKTATQNGQWNIGLGIGLRLNEFNKKK